MALRTISVCSGIGGLDLGVSLATGGQARTVRYVERDAEAASCLVARMGEEGLDPAPVWDDLRTFDARGARRSLGRIDGVIGGIPCQPHSLAGKRGATPETSGLSSAESSERAELGSCSSRTFPGFFPAKDPEPYLNLRAAESSTTSESTSKAGPSTGSSLTWTKTGSMRNGACWEAPTLVPRIAGSGSGSSESGETSKEWPPPSATPYGRNKGGQNPEGPVRPSLDTLARDWSTPTTGSALTNPAQRRRHSPGLGVEAVDHTKLWPTPTAGDHKASGASGYSTASGRHSGTTLTDAVCGPRGAATPKPGPESQPRLNPVFVEWLLGLPHHWSSLQGSGPSVTALTLWRRRMRSELSRLAR
jgi:hypothetical protein